jgi:hypothetical protein
MGGAQRYPSNHDVGAADYRRNFVVEGCFFPIVNLASRPPQSIEHIDELRYAFRQTQPGHPHKGWCVTACGFAY